MPISLECLRPLILFVSAFSIVSVTSAQTPQIAQTNNGGAPQIHGARVVGATPGLPFQFQIPATGDEPLLYRTQNLPIGLILDAQTGVIRGSARYAGTNTVPIQVSNVIGATTRNLTIITGRHQLAQTPPMGWNSWNAYGCGVTGAKVRAAADDLVKSGLNKRGYQYVNVDDCWQGTRDFKGVLRPNSKFGDMKELGDHIHALGLKFGIYSTPSDTTCAGYEGSFGREITDARTYGKWGVDYLKYDYCSYDKVARSVGRRGIIEPFAIMRRALDISGRDIVYSISRYGRDEEWTWAARAPVNANLWRTSRDIKGNYASMARIGFGQDDLYKWAAPTRWNDPDMLYLHKLKPHEQITQMTLWSLLAAPLLIGSDISKLSPFTLDVLGNAEVIEVDQDPLGIGARRVSRVGPTEVWARPLWDGTVAVGLFNRGTKAARVAVKWSDIGLAGAQPVRDLWRQRDVASSENYAVEVAPRGAALVKVGAPKARDYMPVWLR